MYNMVPFQVSPIISDAKDLDPMLSRDHTQWNHWKHCNHCKKNDHCRYCNNVVEAFLCSVAYSNEI